MTHPIPDGGLRHVLSAWTGEGSLYRALAASSDAVDGNEWTEAHVERRAHRILFEMVEPSLARWPHRLRAWFDALPAFSYVTRTAHPFPFPGTDWVETWRRSGFPPTECHGRLRRRGDDSTLLTTLRWTVDRALRIADDARRTAESSTSAVEAQLAAARRLLEVEPVASATAVAPTRLDLSSIRREGSLWASVADAAEGLRLLDGNAADIAFAMLRLDDGDEKIRARLFHLAVLGECLLALGERGYGVTSLRPISGGFGGPAFRVDDPHGGSWDLWFEGAGAWTHYGREEPYRKAAQGAGAGYRPLGADLLFVALDGGALAVECKYGDADYVCRDGYHQAVTYSAEAREIAPLTAAIVVGPEGVAEKGTATTCVGPVTICGVGRLAEALADFFP